MKEKKGTAKQSKKERRDWRGLAGLAGLTDEGLRYLSWPGVQCKVTV